MSRKQNRQQRRLAAHDRRRGKSSLVIGPTDQFHAYAFIGQKTPRCSYDFELDQQTALALIKKGEVQQ